MMPDIEPKRMPSGKDVLPPSRRIVLADVDGTLVQGLTIYSFAEFLNHNGAFDQTSFLKIEEDRAVYNGSDKGHSAYKKFAEDLVDHYAQGLKGQSVSSVAEMAEQFFALAIKEEIPNYRVYPFAKLLMDLMSNVGPVIAISGSPIESLAPLGRYLDFADLKTTLIGQDKGVYTGVTDLNLALDTNKKIVVGQYINDQIDVAQSFAFGDTPHDKSLLEAVGNAFVIGGNKELEKMAKENGWGIIDPRDPNALDQVTQRARGRILGK